MVRGRDRPVLDCALVVAPLLLAAACPVHAQQQGVPSRERAQMLQMQQQLQRVQQDNADLQSKLQKKDEDLKKESEASGTARKELSTVRAQTAARGKELDALHAELDHVRELLGLAQTEIGQLKSVIARRDDALTKAAEREERDQQAQALLGTRLKLQTARGDQCETKHADTMVFAGQMIDLYEKDRLRLCEPVTGLWKPRAENAVQELRSRLSTYQLDAPVEASR